MPSEQQLSDVLSEFARTMATDFPIQGILDHLVQRIVEVMPITGAGVTLIDPGSDPRFVAASDEAALHFEELQALLGQGPCLEAYHSGDPVVVPDLRAETRFPQFVPRALESGLAAVFTFPLRHGDEQLGALDLYCATAGPLDADATRAAQTLADVATAYLLNARAREELRDSSARSLDLSLHDALTGLPNRVLLLERLDHAVVRARRAGKVVAVLFLDLDRLKLVNDLYGHRVGDDLLIAVAARLTAVLRSGDTLARMSGDEFVILCEDLDHAEEVEALALRIEAALAVPFVLKATQVAMSVSVGIAFSNGGDQLSEQLLQEADAAMYQAKRKGGAQHQVVDLREQHLADRRAGLERDLPGARARDELTIVYQPIVATTVGKLTGFEALVRWDHPEQGRVSPSLLVPLAEQSGIINELGGWVLEQACRDQERWRHEHFADLTMAINVSAHQLMAADLVSKVAAVLEATGVPPELVTLEVTEGVLVQDSGRTNGVLRGLKQLGIMLALDDFGTGYASLNYLKRLPIDIVKIDRSFIADLDQDRASHAIVVAVVELAHLLGMTVVAEGVETTAQHEALRAIGCDQSQGFYFGRPMAATEAAAVLQRRECDEPLRPVAPRRASSDPPAATPQALRG
jgi:diguanylate cyclase (GGDEF)-like protein